MTVASSANARAAAASCAACLLIAAWASLPAAAQPAAASDPRALLDGITAPLLARIEEEERRSGPFSRELMDMLASLGLAYQEYGEHDLARTVLDRALFLRRVNEGLFNLDQVPLIERLVESARAVGRHAEAAELEARVFELAQRNLDDPRSVPIFKKEADRDLAYYERYLRGELPPVLSVNDLGGPAATGAFAVRRARRNYRAAIGVLVRNSAADSAVLEELADLEQRLTHTYYLEANAFRITSLSPTDWATVQRASLYNLGRGSYQRRVALARAASTAAVDHARALVELADWSLLFSRNGTAVKGYAQAYALLVDGGVAESAIRELFPVDTPVFLPAFGSNPLEAVVADAPGHVDVDFEIGKYGQPRRVRLVAASDELAEQHSKAVLTAIARARYRPSPLADAESAYRLRYSLADGRLTPRL